MSSERGTSGDGDSSSWNATIVDGRDGNPIESRPDLAGTHPTPEERKNHGIVGEIGLHPSSKWPAVREALIEWDDERVSAIGLSAGRDFSHKTARKWLDILVERDLSRKINTPLQNVPKRRRRYATPDPDDLPEVLRE